jgi:hypothetical protein
MRPSTSASLRAALAALTATALALAPSAARANERHFAFTHESATLPQGTVELEPWITMHGFRNSQYMQFDERLEFEGGLTDRLMGAFYLNSTQVTTPGAMPGTTTTTTSINTSVEGKYRLLDSVADPIGLALYGEVTAGTNFFELEGKVILDRRFGNFLFAANAIVEHDWFFTGGETQKLLELEADVAGAFFITPHMTLGLEARWYNSMLTDPEVLWQDSSIYAGPVFSYSWSHFWTAIAITPQIAAPHLASRNDIRNIDTQDALAGRLVVGFHF